MRRLTSPLVALCAYAATAMIHPAQAEGESYPERPIRLIVPFPPGGNTDTLSRLAAQKMAEQLGTTIVVDNRAGAGSQIGIEAAGRATPDGYTLLFGPADGMSILPALKPDLSYDPVTGFTAIARIATSPFVYAVNPKLPVHSLPELLDAARKKPGEIRYGTPGVGSIAHLAMELLQSRTGTKFSHIPYKGGGPALTGFLSGDTQVMVSSLALIEKPAQAGQVRMLAQTGAARHPNMAAIPTVEEAGTPGVEVVSWFGIFAPAQTPDYVVKKITATVSAMVGDAAFAKRLADLGATPAFLEPDEFAAFVAGDKRKWSGIVKAAGIQIND